MSSRLSRREQLFCQHYALSRNGRQAAAASGYAETSASSAATRLLKRDKITQEIRRIEGANLTESNVTRAALEAFLVKIIADTTLTVDQRLKAADQLAKLKGFYIRTLDKLLGITPNEIKEAIQDLQQTIDITPRITNGIESNKG
ncbi:MAG: terminase small subunit [Bacteroidetes bacterium]|nr:terminase small subunit [Bacteroidota bacterium]